MDSIRRRLREMPEYSRVMGGKGRVRSSKEFTHALSSAKFDFDQHKHVFLFSRHAGVRLSIKEVVMSNGVVVVQYGATPSRRALPSGLASFLVAEILPCVAGALDSAVEWKFVRA